MYIYACNKINIKRAQKCKIEHIGVCRRFGVWKGKKKCCNFSVFFLYKFKICKLAEERKKKKNEYKEAIVTDRLEI